MEAASAEGMEDAADHPERPVHTHEEYGHPDHPDNAPPRERGEDAAWFFPSYIQHLGAGYCIQENRSSPEAINAQRSG